MYLHHVPRAADMLMGGSWPPVHMCVCVYICMMHAESWWASTRFLVPCLCMYVCMYVYVVGMVGERTVLGLLCMCVCHLPLGTLPRIVCVCMCIHEACRELVGKHTVLGPLSMYVCVHVCVCSRAGGLAHGSWPPVYVCLYVCVCTRPTQSC
jgi:hypothetical protein